jgi:hypothetical protein
MPKVTVTLGSSRPGGIDISLYGLSRQTYDDFEVVFVDARYHKRHARVLDAVKASGLKQPFYHVPNHRNQPKPWGTTCAGYNTGFMLADGEIVIMLLDYGYTPPDWVEKHVSAHRFGQRVVMAPHDYRPMPAVRTLDGGPPLKQYEGHIGMTPESILAERDRYDEISIFVEPFDPAKLGPSSQPPHCDPKMFRPEGPNDELLFHTKNESFPFANMLAINGMDEHYDRMGGPGDPEMAQRLCKSGLSGYITRAIVACPNPRWIMPNPNAASFHDKPTPGHEWRGCYLDGQAYFERSWRERRLVAPNPFNILERQREIWGWREMSQEREAVIPYVEIADGEYFRGL